MILPGSWTNCSYCISIPGYKNTIYIHIQVSFSYVKGIVIHVKFSGTAPFFQNTLLNTPKIIVCTFGWLICCCNLSGGGCRFVGCYTIIYSCYTLICLTFTAFNVAANIVVRSRFCLYCLPSMRHRFIEVNNKVLGLRTTLFMLILHFCHFVCQTSILYSHILVDKTGFAYIGLPEYTNFYPLEVVSHYSYPQLQVDKKKLNLSTLGRKII